jgi:hypothetical protein
MPHITGSPLAATTHQVAASVRRFTHVAGVPSALAVSALLFAELAGQAITDALDSPTGLACGLALTGATTVMLYRRWEHAFTSASSRDDFGRSGNDKLARRRGLVLLLGLDSADPASAAAVLLARMPNLEFLALVGTPQTTEQKVPVRVLDRILPAAGHRLPSSHVRVWDFANAASISDAEQSTAEALRWLTGRGLAPAEIVVDISAGRRPMTYGAKDAADAAEVEAQYLAEEWDTVNNEPIAHTRHFKIVRSFD